MRSALAPLVALVLSVAPLHASADAISPPPDCPPGAAGRSSHAGEWCQPSPCEDDAGCRSDERCRAWRVCTQTSMVTPGGRRIGPAEPAPVELAIASCSPSAACDGTGEPRAQTVGVLQGEPTCTDRNYCLPLSALGPAEAPPTARGIAVPVIAPEGETVPTADPIPPPPAASGCACRAQGSRSADGGLAIIALMSLALAARKRRSARPE